jgi:thymidylate kinase
VSSYIAFRLLSQFEGRFDTRRTHGGGDENGGEARGAHDPRSGQLVEVGHLEITAPVPDTQPPVFIALEGLRGCGKSTLAPLLAARLGAQHMPTFPREYQQARAFLDHHSHDVNARAHLFLSALMITADRVRDLLDAGTSVVIDSYIQRTVATHRAYGATIDLAEPADLPAPITILLECTSAARAVRLRDRVKQATWWDELADQVADRIEDEYSRFAGHRVDTTGKQPHETLAAILSAISRTRGNASAAS